MQLLTVIQQLTVEDYMRQFSRKKPIPETKHIYLCSPITGERKRWLMIKREDQWIVIYCERLDELNLQFDRSKNVVPDPHYRFLTGPAFAFSQDFITVLNHVFADTATTLNPVAYNI